MWSVCEWLHVITETKPMRAGSTTRSLILTWGVSVPAYLRVRESER